MNESGRGDTAMNIQTIKVRLRIFVEPDSDGFYAYCPELKGLHVGGATEEEAVQNALNAASAYLMSLMKHNDPLPVGSQAATYSPWELITKGLSMLFGRPHSRIEELALPVA